MIHYDIDTTENGYKKFEGNIELVIQLKHILFKNDVVPDLVGYLYLTTYQMFLFVFLHRKNWDFLSVVTDGKNYII